jgi:hypothetical protein
MSRDYNTDFYAWAQAQARLLRGGRCSQLLVEHVAEEIKDLGPVDGRNQRVPFCCGNQPPHPTSPPADPRAPC